VFKARGIYWQRWR